MKQQTPHTLYFFIHSGTNRREYQHVHGSGNLQRWRNSKS
jgi:hypothetical protein